MLIDFIFKLFLLINIVFSRNPVELNNVCTFPNDYGRTPGFAVVVGRLAFLLSESDYKELLRYPGAFLIATQDTMTTSPNFELSGFPFFTGLYGLTVFPLDLLVELRGYFVPPKSGQYTFTLTDSDDAAIIFFGNPSAFPCGDLQTWPKPSEEDITVTDNLFPSRTLYLIEGVAYPMRIAYYNGFGAGRLNAAFIDPSGTRHTNWEGYIWQYSPCSTCNYSPPPTATTIYSSGWVVSETTTGTSYSIYTGIDGVESTYRIFLVEVPTVTPSLSIPPITTVTISGPNYVEVEVISFVSTTNKEGVPVTGSTTINGTRDYLDADAPHNSLAPAPSPVTHTIDLGNGVTNYEVVSYRTTTNEYGGYITVTETVTFKAPPVTVVELKGDDYVESDWVSFFITTDEKGDIITGSTTINGTRDYLDADAPHNSLAPAPSPVTHTIDLGNGVTNYEVVSYRTTTNEYGGYITVTETVTFKAPPVTVVELKGDDYVESDWVSFFITTDEKGDIITGSTTINGTRDYLDADAPHNSLAPAPSPVTHTIDLGNGVTNYEVVSYRTTTNEYGGYITVTETVTFKAPPVTVVELKGDDYVESDWVSFFITTDEKGDIITGSTTINGTRDYLDADAPTTRWLQHLPQTTTNEYGGYITVTETVTFKAPPVTVVELKGDDYVESDWVSFFITTDEKGDIITGSTTINGTRDYLDADAPHNSLAPAPSPVTHTIDLGNGVTNYEVVSYRTTTNEYGGYITVTETVTFKAPPVTVVELKGDDYVESDWVSFFITTDEKGDIITGSTTINGTRDYLDADAPHNSLAPAPSPVTHTIDLGNGVTNYEVVSYRTTTNEYGGYITVTETVTFKAPPVTVVELKGDDYVESDWVSFFITTDEKGDIITGSTTINGTRDYLDADAPHNSLAPAPSPVTHTIDLGNGVTNYEVVSYRTTTNEYGGYITVTETVTFKAPPVTVVELKGDDYVESDWVSFFITTDEKGDIITGSTTINGTRDYLDADAPTTRWLQHLPQTTTNEYGGYITVTETVTFKAPPVTVVELKGDDYVESDWVSFFITTDEKGDIITGSTTINGTRDYLDADAPHNSLAPAPSPVTHTIDLGNGVTNYEVVSYRTTTNEYGGYITVTETVTFKAPPVTVVELKGDDYVESDWVSFFITTDEKGDIITGSTTINGTRDYLDADAPHNSLAPAPSPVTHTIDLGNGVTNYEVVSYRTTTNEYGGYITVTETVTFKAPPVTVVELKGDDYVESDWVSFFITTDEKGDIITGSTTINGTRDYLDADAPTTRWLQHLPQTTTNEYGGYITVTETVTFKAPPVTVVELKGDDYVESDWVSFFITTDEKGDIITGSTTINGTRDYLDADAPHNSLAPAPSPVTHTIDLGNGVTNYEVVSYRTTTNEYGGYITVTETVTFKAPPVTVVELKGDDYVESDWVSFFITTDEKGDIITGSTTINGTRDYLDADAPTTRWLQHLPQTTTNEYGGYITVTETVTFKAPPVTVVELKGDDYVESDWVSFFITTDEKGDIITGSTTINGTRDYLDADAPHNSLAPAPSPVTHTIDLGNGVTNYEVVSYRTTTNEYGGYITVTETVTFKAPPVTVVELKGDDYVESDWVSFFITTDEKGDIITGSTTINGTRDYLDADAPHNSLAPAPSPVTHTIDLGNGVTNYEVVSYRTTTNEYGGYITVTETVTFKAPPVTVVELKGDDYVESDWVSFFITTDEKGDIITGSTTINGTRDYLDADAPHNSLAPAPSPVTHTIDLGNGVTNYEVVSYRTTTNEYGGYITVTETVTFKAPPVTVVELKGDDYVESDWVSFFITTDEKGDIITGSTTINGTRDYLDADAPHNSLAPAPSPVTHTIDLGNGVTNYEVVSYRTTTNEYGGYITVTETVTFKAPPVTVVELKGDDYVESDWVSFFITTDEKGDIITGSTTINGTRDYLDADAPTTRWLQHLPQTTTNEYGGYITVTETVTFKAPPVTVVELKGDDYVESDWVSFFITTDEKGDIITGSTTINGTRDYLDADAPHNSLAPAPSPVTHTIDLGNGVTNYEVVSYRTTTNEYGGYITVTETVTFKAPPVTVVELKGDDYVESDWVSFFITTDEKGDIITGSTTINGTRDYLDADAPHNSLAPAPSPVTHTIDLGNGVTNYEVVSYRTTTNEYGGYITVTETVTFKAPPVTVVELKGDDYVESDWVSFFITTDEKGDIITGSTTINGTRDYLDADAPHNSLAPAPSPVTHTIDLGNGVTNYEVVSYRTTTNEYGGYITVTETVTFKAPPVTVVELKGDDYVESDWVSFFITTDEKGDIITGSTTINGTRDYLDADAPHNSLAPAPSPVTHTIDLGNGVTNYEVVSYRTTTNEYGGYITVTETVTFKAPPVTVVELKGDDYVESDWVSFFITTDEKGDIITGSTTINGTRDYLDADAPTTRWLQHLPQTTTNEYGGYITVTETVTFKAPPVTVVELKGDDYVESDWVSFFITTDEKGDIITGSTTINGTRDYLDADAPHNSLAPAPSPVTHTIDLGNGVTNYEVVSYRTTTNEYGGYITVTETVTFKAPPVTVVELKGDDYVESDWVSFFITTDEKGDIITGSTTINGTRDYLDADAPHNSLAPAPSPVTHTIDLGNGSPTMRWCPTEPPRTSMESDWVSFFITTDEKGDIITGSTTINGTRDYLDADAPHNSLAPPPSPVTNLIIDVYENVTEYEVVSYYIKANPYGQYLTLTETITFKAPPTTVVEVKGKDYDIRIYVSYFITVANNGVLITESTTLSEVKECLGAEGISKLKSDLYNWAPTQLHFPNSTVSSRSIDSCTNECDKMDQNSSKVKNPNAKLGHIPDALSITQELYGEMPPNSSHMSIETFPTSLTSSRPNTIGESGASSSNLIMSNKLIDSVTVNEIFRLSTISSTNFNSTTTTRDSLANVALELISKLSPHKSDAFPAATPGNERNSNSLQPSRDDSSSIGNSLMHSRDTIQLYNNNQSSKPELYVSKTLTTHSEPATSGLISAEPPRSSIIFSPSTINLYSRFNSTLGTVISKYSTMSVSPSMNVSYSKQFNKTIGSVYYPDSQIINGCASGILNYWQCNFIFPILVLQLFFIL
ncbi:Hypothetical protein J6897_02796 [Nakaseomyces glabratus]